MNTSLAIVSGSEWGAMQFDADAVRRFWSYVDKSGSCWVWTRSRVHDGYGQFFADGRKWRAHRVAWLLTYGAIPPHLIVRHRCDNPSCVRPDHLLLGTHKDNTQDARDRARLATGETHGLNKHPERRAYGNRNGTRKHPDRVARGERIGSAKLTADQVIAIRQSYADGLSQRQIARAYGVGQACIRDIVNFVTWREVK